MDPPPAAGGGLWDTSTQGVLASSDGWRAGCGQNPPPGPPRDHVSPLPAPTAPGSLRDARWESRKRTADARLCNARHLMDLHNTTSPPTPSWWAIAGFTPFALGIHEGCALGGSTDPVDGYADPMLGFADYIGGSADAG